ncbi:MAG: putative rane transporter protein [Devosia sp.]|nr:putative rane transporter protein [Devosia sp.]
MQVFTQMFSVELLLLWLIAGGAAWIQALTGFAFGLILVGTVGLLGLIPLPEAAILSSLMVLFNGAMVLRADWRQIDRGGLALLMLGSLPGLLIGYALLLYLAKSAISALALLLGALIIFASLQMLHRPRQRPERSSSASFVATGLAGGIMGGLFSTAGPPIIWQMYRQPLSHVMVRSTLVAVFFVNALARLGLVFATTGVPVQVWLAAAGALPMVLGGTLLAQKFPPPIAPIVLRRIAATLLLLSGLALCASPLAILLKEFVP